MGIKGISSAFGLSRNTERKYVRAYQESGLPIEKVLEMSDEHLYGMSVGDKSRVRESSDRRIELETLLPEYASRLKRKGITVRKLFEGNTGVSIRMVIAMRISVSCCGGICFRPRP